MDVSCNFEDHERHTPIHKSMLDHGQDKPRQLRPASVVRIPEFSTIQMQWSRDSVMVLARFWQVTMHVYNCLRSTI
jgi:hypothetical protein